MKITKCIGRYQFWYDPTMWMIGFTFGPVGDEDGEYLSLNLLCIGVVIFL